MADYRKRREKRRSQRLITIDGIDVNINALIAHTPSHVIRNSADSAHAFPLTGSFSRLVILGPLPVGILHFVDSSVLHNSPQRPSSVYTGHIIACWDRASLHASPRHSLERNAGRSNLHLAQ